MCMVVCSCKGGKLCDGKLCDGKLCDNIRGSV